MQVFEMHKIKNQVGPDSVSTVLYILFTTDPQINAFC